MEEIVISGHVTGQPTTNDQNITGFQVSSKALGRVVTIRCEDAAVGDWATKHLGQGDIIRTRGHYAPNDQNTFLAIGIRLDN